MDHGGVQKDVAERSQSLAVKPEEFSDPDLWLQREHNGDVR